MYARTQHTCGRGGVIDVGLKQVKKRLAWETCHTAFDAVSHVSKGNTHVEGSGSEASGVTDAVCFAGHWGI